MKALEDDADYKLKTLKENDLESKDFEAIKAQLKVSRCNIASLMSRFLKSLLAYSDLTRVQN